MALEGYYSHNRSDGTTFAALLERDQVPYRSACENLQLQAGSDYRQALRSWLDSPAHYDCLMHPDMKTAGIAYQLYDKIAFDSVEQEMFVFTFIATR